AGARGALTVALLGGGRSRRCPGIAAQLAGRAPHVTEMQHMSANVPSRRMKRCGERCRPLSVAVAIRSFLFAAVRKRIAKCGVAMSNRWNPIHAAACGIVAGFALFAVMIARSESWWPNPAV